MLLEKLRKLNRHIEIKNIDSKDFNRYGRIINEFDFTNLIKYMEKNTQIPREGNVYTASVVDMERDKINNELSNIFYGGMPIQIGFCNGRNGALNGLEYHKSSEINVAVTDMILLLGKVQDIKNNIYEARNVEAFFVPKGMSIEMYQTTLHFAPCKTCEDGFKCIVILPRGTNTPLNKSNNVKGEESELLFMMNKWLLVHPSRKALVEKGAHVGILGENIQINIKFE